ncbi:2Fe-2S iron-sulfur cluster-binding protein [Kocuria sp. CPCC 205263]|uniref:PDR/VanB family oxidoreductase n=1 Tax=Kocuria sp. CPCC 205263 TaxID=3073555 RepID=UPI0034D79E64
MVLAVQDEAPGVRSVVLGAEDGTALPEFVAGSHLLVECATKINAYSLTGSGIAPAEYTISVLRQDDGGGGSVFIHGLRPGDRIQTSQPRNGFAPRATATHHLLIAGGIGVTPVLSHAKTAVRWGHSFTVLYTFRDGGSPHLEELRDLCGDRLLACPGRETFIQELTGTLARQPMGTHLYVCGGNGLIQSVLTTARRLGWPEERLHYEIFDAEALDPGEPFVVDLQRTGTEVLVPSGVSMLEALEDEGLRIPNMCRQGVCGECKIPVTSGTPLHRDSYLSAEDKTTNDTTMPCVSRAIGDRLGVDL